MTPERPSMQQTAEHVFGAVTRFKEQAIRRVMSPGSTSLPDCSPPAAISLGKPLRERVSGVDAAIVCRNPGYHSWPDTPELPPSTTTFFRLISDWPYSVRRVGGVEVSGRNLDLRGVRTSVNALQEGGKSSSSGWNALSPDVESLQDAVGEKPFCL